MANLNVTDREAGGQGVSRRDFFRAGGIAATAVAVGSSGLIGTGPAHAGGADCGCTRCDVDANAAAIQGGGFYRMPLGDGGATATLISDGGFVFSPIYPTLGSNVATEQEVYEAIAARFIEKDNVTGYIHALLIEATDGKTVLIDTGAAGGMGPTTGKLIENLKRAGKSPEDIDVVVITHAHPDHMGGVFVPGPGGDREKRELAFANAEIMISETEYKFWMQENADLSKGGLDEGGQAWLKGAAKSGLSAIPKSKLTRIGDGATIAKGVTAVLAAGHTPGHLMVRIDGVGNAAPFLYLTDIVHVAPVQFANPTWSMGFDVDMQEAAKTRAKVLDMVAADKLLVSGTHIPFPAAGHLVGHAGGYEWLPSLWQW